MIATIESLIEWRTFAFIEASPGSGKTYAYLRHLKKASKKTNLDGHFELTVQQQLMEGIVSLRLLQD